MGPCPCRLLSDKHSHQSYYTLAASLAQRELGQGTQRNQPGREEAEKSPNGLSPQACSATVLGLGQTPELSEDG
jgi:hypothetical protein